MKKFNRKLIRGTNWALAGLLSLLGFSGCDKIFQMEYGSPMANFKVTGRVTDEEGRPLSGVRIVAPNVDGKWGKQAYPSPQDSVTVGFAKDDLKGGDRSWFLGAAEKEVNVTLKRKKR